MTEILQDLSVPAMSAAIEANFFEVALLWRSWPAAEVHDGPDTLWTLTGIPFGLFNVVARAQLTLDSVDGAIEEAIARCGQGTCLWSGSLGQLPDPTTYRHI